MKSNNLNKTFSFSAGSEKEWKQENFYFVRRSFLSSAEASSA
jgi:hypothetical protein